MRFTILCGSFNQYNIRNNIGDAQNVVMFSELIHFFLQTLVVSQWRLLANTTMAIHIGLYQDGETRISTEGGDCGWGAAQDGPMAWILRY